MDGTKFSELYGSIVDIVDLMNDCRTIYESLRGKRYFAENHDFDQRYGTGRIEVGYGFRKGRVVCDAAEIKVTEAGLELKFAHPPSVQKPARHFITNLKTTVHNFLHRNPDIAITTDFL